MLTDEYLEQELVDAEEVLGWLATQPWCSGQIGMMGISWGGFNALQLAARRPPSLGAIVTVCSTDDRYADDVHYMGGCLLSDNLSWASTMFAYTSCPPDPAVVGERWRQMWHERLAGSGLWLETWLHHPEGAAPIPVIQAHPGEGRWTVSRDLVNYRAVLEVIKDLGVLHFEDIDLDVAKRAVERYSWVGDDMASVCGETQWTMSFTRGDWQVRTVTRTILTSTPSDF